MVQTVYFLNYPPTQGSGCCRLYSNMKRLSCFIARTLSLDPLIMVGVHANTITFQVKGVLTELGMT